MDSPYKLGATNESVVTPAGESESIIGDSVAANNEKSPLGYPARTFPKKDQSTPAINGQEDLLLKRPMSEPKLVPCPHRPSLPTEIVASTFRSGQSASDGETSWPFRSRNLQCVRP